MSWDNAEERKKFNVERANEARRERERQAAKRSGGEPPSKGGC
jgi:hypothetical protein